MDAGKLKLREFYRMKARKFRANNPEYVKKYLQNWRKRNGHKYLAYEKTRHQLRVNRAKDTLDTVNEMLQKYDIKASLQRTKVQLQYTITLVTTVSEGKTAKQIVPCVLEDFSNKLNQISQEFKNGLN